MTEAQKNYARVKKYQDAHRQQGLCIQCPAPALAGKVRCADCLKRRTVIRKSRRDRAEELGMCYQCHTATKMTSHKLCEDCYFKGTCASHFGSQVQWRSLKEKFFLQNGKCALSGVSLTLGIDVELDHIVPSSRGGKDELDNVQWVLCVVNRMKDHMLETEFFGLVEKLYRTMKERNASVN